MPHTLYERGHRSQLLTVVCDLIGLLLFTSLPSLYITATILKIIQADLDYSIWNFEDAFIAPYPQSPREEIQLFLSTEIECHFNYTSSALVVSSTILRDKVPD